MTEEYWFVRSIGPKGHGRRIYPIHWKGWAVLFGFIAAMILGGASFLVIALTTNNFFFGILSFVVLAIIGAGTLLWAASAKSDPNRNAADLFPNTRQR